MAAFRPKHARNPFKTPDIPVHGSAAQCQILLCVDGLCPRHDAVSYSVGMSAHRNDTDDNGMHAGMYR